MNKENNFKSNVKESALKGDIILATKTSLELLNQKILEVESEIINTTQAMGESANNDPDLRENYGFRDLRLKASEELPKKIHDLKTKKSKIILSKDSDNIDGQINFGDKFTIEMYFPNETIPDTGSFQLLGPLEVELHNQLDQNEEFQIISYLSPLGMAAWNHPYQKNPQFSYETDNGEVRCIFIR
jgi:transcription elongation GreA/GreB family factor